MLASTLSATSSTAAGGGVADRSSRSAAEVSDRTRSIARRWAIVITQVVALPRLASNLDAVRQTSSSTSWATSSDWAGSRSTLRIKP